MKLEKATNDMMNLAADEKNPEKKELFEKSAAAMRALLSLEGEIKDHIEGFTCKDKSQQKYFRLGQEHIANVVRYIVSEVSE